MIYKIVFLSALIVVCSSQQAQHHGQIVHQTVDEHGHPQHGHAVSSQSFISNHEPSQHQQYNSGGSGGHHEEYPHHHPSYKYEYSVHDDHTKDIKSQSENRDGDVTHGQYQLLQPDGHVRTVVYHVDKDSGFNAEVKYSGQGGN